MQNIPYIHKYFPHINKEKRNELKIDTIGLYSISPPKNAEIITNYVKKYFKNSNIIVTDAMAGVGGNSLSFATSLYHVNAIEIDEERFYYLAYNIGLFSKTNVLCINENYLNIMHKLKQDVIFIDPPWGGKNYKNANKMTIDIDNISLENICNNIYENKLCSMLILKLPLNYDVGNFGESIKKYMKIEILQKILILLFIFD